MDSPFHWRCKWKTLLQDSWWCTRSSGSRDGGVSLLLSWSFLSQSDHQFYSTCLQINLKQTICRATWNPAASTYFLILWKWQPYAESGTELLDGPAGSEPAVSAFLPHHYVVVFQVFPFLVYENGENAKKQKEQVWFRTISECGANVQVRMWDAHFCSCRPTLKCAAFDGWKTSTEGAVMRDVRFNFSCWIELNSVLHRQ